MRVRNKYFGWYVENPLKTYNIIKKYFKPLTAKYYIGRTSGKNAKILEVVGWDLCWKSKWSTPRHEWNPFFKVILFNKLEFKITWDYINDAGEDESMEYWEAALSWLYFNKNLQSSIKDATGWEHLNPETNTWEKKKYNFLREPYQQDYDDGNLTEIFYESI